MSRDNQPQVRVLRWPPLEDAHGFRIFVIDGTKSTTWTLWTAAGSSDARWFLVSDDIAGAGVALGEMYAATPDEVPTMLTETLGEVVSTIVLVMIRWPFTQPTPLRWFGGNNPWRMP